MVALPPMLQPATREQSSSAASATRAFTALTEEDLGLAIERLGNRLQLRGGLGEVDQLDVGAAQRGHLAPLPTVSRVDGVEPEAGGEHSVERGRGPAPLDVSEHGGSGLVAGVLLDLALEPMGDPAKPHVAEGIS